MHARTADASRQGGSWAAAAALPAWSTFAGLGKDTSTRMGETIGAPDVEDPG